MATLEQLSTALRNADAAGDTEAAARLAQAIKGMQQAPAAVVTADVASSGMGDVAKSVGSGLVGGTTAVLGMPGDFLNAADQVTKPVAGWMMDRIFGQRSPEQQKAADVYRSEHPVSGVLPTSSGMNAAIENVVPGATSYEPQTTAGRFAKSAAEFVPGALTLGGARTLPQAASAAVRYGLVPGLASEGAVEATHAEGTVAEPFIRTVAAIGSGGLSSRLGAAPKTPLPSTEEIKALSQDLYKQAEKAGLLLDNASWAPTIDDIGQVVMRAGAHPEITPQAVAALKELKKVQGISPSLQEVDQVRQIIGNVARGNDPNERRLAGMMLDKLDSYMSSITSKDVLTGDKRAVPMIAQARNLWKTKSKAETIDDLLYRAENAVGANYTSAGMETALRQQFRALANNPNRMRAFSLPERAMILKVVRGAPVQNALRRWGKLAPTGMLSMVMSPGAGAAAGTVLAGPVGGVIGGVALPLSGRVAKTLATNKTLGNVRSLDEMVRSAAQPPHAALPRRWAPMSAPLLGVYSHDLLQMSPYKTQSLP